jgi:hypothetical protein
LQRLFPQDLEQALQSVVFQLISREPLGIALIRNAEDLTSILGKMANPYTLIPDRPWQSDILEAAVRLDKTWFSGLVLHFTQDVTLSEMIAAGEQLISEHLETVPCAFIYPWLRMHVPLSTRVAPVPPIMVLLRRPPFIEPLAAFSPSETSRLRELRIFHVGEISLDKLAIAPVTVFGKSGTIGRPSDVFGKSGATGHPSETRDGLSSGPADGRNDDNGKSDGDSDASIDSELEMILTTQAEDINSVLQRAKLMVEADLIHKGVKGFQVVADFRNNSEENLARGIILVDIVLPSVRKVKQVIIRTTRM